MTNNLIHTLIQRSKDGDKPSRRPRTRMRKIVLSVMTAAVIMLALVAFPDKWGGRMSYLNLDGVSMQPTLHAGDLAIVYKSGDYKVGDVVAYKPVGGGSGYYLHRIKSVTSDGYIFKGDNNDEDDPRTVTPDQMIGKMLFHVEGAGKLITNRMFLYSVAAMILVLTFGMEMLPRRYRPRTLARGFTGHIRSGLQTMRAKGPAHIKYNLFIVALICLVAGSALYLRPTKQERSRDVSAKLTYSAEAEKGDAYPDGKIGTGDTIYTKLADELSIDWTLKDVKASGLTLHLKDGQDWSRQIEMNGTWVNGHYRAIIDLKEVIKLTEQIQQQTLVPNSTYTLVLKPEGVGAGAPALPSYEFTLNSGVLRAMDKDKLTWSPAVLPQDNKRNQMLWSVMLWAAALTFMIMGIYDNQPKATARRVMLAAEPAGEWLDLTSVDEIEQMALDMDAPVMEHTSGLYAIAPGSTWGYRYQPSIKSAQEVDREVA